MSEATETVEGEVLPEAPEEEQQPTAQPEGEQEEQQQDKPEGEKKLKGVGKRLHQLTSERDYWKQQALQAQQPKEPDRSNEPLKTLKDFEYDEGQYSAYLFERAERRAAEVAKREASNWRQEQEQQTRRQSFDAELADIADSDHEFFDKWAATPISADVGQALLATKNRADVALYFANNPDIAYQLSYLPPMDAALQVGAISARLEAEKARAKDKLVSKAPSPPPKIEGREPGLTVSASSPDSDKLSMNDWLKRREKELAKRKG